MRCDLPNASPLAPHHKWQAAFRKKIDSLNFFMAQRYLPSELQTRLREYVHRSDYLHHEAGYQDLINNFSPLLQACNGM